MRRQGYERFRVHAFSEIKEGWIIRNLKLKSGNGSIKSFVFFLPFFLLKVSQLYKMLNSDDVRWSKNACFAISCLTNKKWGQDKILSSYFCSEILETLARLLFAEDQETGWFSAV